MTESVIDFPKDRLCPEIWDRVIDMSGSKETWTLKPEVKAKAIEIWNAVCPEATTIHITGSITSNSYTENVDIDLHFLDVGIEFQDSSLLEDFLKLVRNRYVDKQFIGKHPFEVYYQDNKFQDMMSVGCYDVLQDKWIVGPELVDPAFNPYSEYYAEILQKSENVALYVRNVIFSIYEMTIAWKKNAGTPYADNIKQVLVSKLNNVLSLYDSIRNMRKVYSTPTSREEALQFRASRKWKVADGAFKLFDKYGYLAILKDFILIAPAVDVAENSDTEILAADAILNSVKRNISNADKLAEKEMFEDEQLDEGLMSNLAIAALLAIPGILPKDALAKELNNVPKNKMYMSSAPVQKAIDNATVDNKMIGNFSYRNSVNILQWVYYTEAANQSLEGRKAIFSIVWNRAGGKPELLILVSLKSGISKKTGKRVYQFSEWNPGNNWGLVAPKSNKDWHYKVPKDIANPKVQKIWKEGEEFAKLMLSGNWKSNIGNCNMIASDNDNEDAKNSWGKTCKYKIGDHRFGYDPSLDGFRIKKPVIAKTSVQKNQTPIISHIVKKGDTLWKIAKANKTTALKLADKNNIDVNSILKIGLKLTV